MIRVLPVCCVYSWFSSSSVSVTSGNELVQEVAAEQLEDFWWARREEQGGHHQTPRPVPENDHCLGKVDQLRSAGLDRAGLHSAGLHRAGLHRAGLHRAGLTKLGF